MGSEAENQGEQTSSGVQPSWSGFGTRGLSSERLSNLPGPVVLVAVLWKGQGQGAGTNCLLHTLRVAPKGALGTMQSQALP